MEFSLLMDILLKKLRKNMVRHICSMIEQLPRNRNIILGLWKACNRFCLVVKFTCETLLPPNANVRYKLNRYISSSKKIGQTDLNKMKNQFFPTLFCMQNRKPNNLEFFVLPNSKRKIVDNPMIMLA